MASKRKQKKQKGQKRQYGRMLIVFGVLCLAVWAIHTAVVLRSLRMNDSALAALKERTAPERMVTFLTTRTIPNLAVVASGKIDNQWIVAPRAANHVSGSGTPGGNTNIILYGHNTVDAMGPIRWLKTGDEITLTTANGQSYVYRIFHLQEVDPSDTSLLAPTNTEILTLYTCSGFFDSKRFVVRAIPK